MPDDAASRLLVPRRDPWSMRQVDACDFCGDAPDGVFEVVPAVVPDGPVRLALCADCRTTLETVVDPLLAADASEYSGSEDTGRSSQPTPDTDAAASAAPDAPAAVLDSDDENERGDSANDPPEESSDEGITIEAQGGGTPAERPDGYAQVLRLLENRDGEMPRGDLRALATNAYDLTDRTFEAAVDAAIENGDVEESSDGLRRT